MSGSRPAFIFDFEWRTTLFVLLLTPLMLSLGFWQLQRADEKAALAASFDARQLAGPRPLSTLWEAQGDELAYAPVAFEGRFLPTQYLLLDNRIQGGKFGYEVVGILVLEEGGSVLVNRGWIAGDASRQILPDVPVVHGKIEVRGHVYVSPGQPYLLGEQALEGGWPLRLQALEMEKLVPAVAAETGADVFPYPVRIDAGATGALSVDWQVINVSPAKHQGYAVQWFAMAAVLAVFFVLRSTNLWQRVTGSGRPEA